MHNTMKLLAFAALSVAAGLVPVHAEPRTTFDLVLTVDRVERNLGCDALLGHARPIWGCIGAGDTFSGHFAVDSFILATNGLNRTAGIYDFYLPFGGEVYSTGPDNTILAGFRNGLGFASAPGYIIESGQVVDLVGGVFGRADIPFVDMYGNAGVPRNHFVAYDGVTAAYGSLAVTAAVPEPQTYAMLLAGLGLVALAARRRRSAEA